MKLLYILLITLFLISHTFQSQKTHSREAEASDIVIQQQQPSPKVGGYNKKSLSAAQQTHTYLTNKLSDIQNMRLIEYKTQVVNGWNHLLKYVDRNNRRRTIIVYQSIDGEFRISSDTNQEEM